MFCKVPSWQGMFCKVPSWQPSPREGRGLTGGGGFVGLMFDAVYYLTTPVAPLLPHSPAAIRHPREVNLVLNYPDLEASSHELAAEGTWLQ